MNDDNCADYYNVLGVAKSATVSEIHQAYWKLASIYHPDKGGTHGQMVRLVEAWRILSDPAKRARYDQQVKYQHDGWRSRQHSYDVQEALKRAKDHTSRAWPEFEAIYQKAFYTFNRDFYGKELNEKAAGPYSPLLRPKNTECRYEPPIQKLPAENTIKRVGGLLFIYAVKVLILLLAAAAALLFYRHYAGEREKTHVYTIQSTRMSESRHTFTTCGSKCVPDSERRWLRTFLTVQEAR